MWATLHAFEHNNLDGMTLIPAPKYGQTLLRSWAFAFTDIPNGLRQMCQFQTRAVGLAERVTTV